MAFAWSAVRTIGAMAAQQFPQLAGLRMDMRVVAFAVALTIVAAWCAAWARVARRGLDPQDALRAGAVAATGRAHHRVLAGLVVAESGCRWCCWLGVADSARFASVLHADPGFDTSRILALDVKSLHVVRQGRRGAAMITLA